MNDDTIQPRLRIERVLLIFAVLTFLGGCALGGECPISPHWGARSDSRLQAGAKTPLILKGSRYAIPKIKMRALPPSFGCPVIPPDLVHAKPRPGK
ncbi:MAG: hypothetical protein ACYCS1_06220 [Gammaproteobacteria bacterium]